MRRQSWLTFVVVGAGPTGVEMAGQIAELAHDALRRDFRWVDTTRARVLLVEAADRVLAGFPEQLSRRASRSLEGLGVTPLARHTVVDVTADSVAIESRDGALERVGARTAIWAAGVTASGLAAKLADEAGLDVDRAGRLSVEPGLTLPGHPEVFAIGDMVRVQTPDRRRDAPRARPCGHAAGPTPPAWCAPFAAACGHAPSSGTYRQRATWRPSGGRGRSPT